MRNSSDWNEEQRRRHREHGHPPLGDDGSLSSLLLRCSHVLRRGGWHMAQERVLRILAEHGGAMGQRQLQEVLGVRPGSLSELAGKLEDKGLLNRARDEGDRRNVTLQLTEAGRAAAAESGEHARPDPFAVLSVGEQDTLRELLQKVLNGQEAGGSSWN